jgi:hypothetical protein
MVFSGKIELGARLSAFSGGRQSMRNLAARKQPDCIRTSARRVVGASVGDFVLPVGRAG